MEIPLMRSFLIVLMFVTECSVLAQEGPIIWSGEIRFRSEVDGRDFRSGTAMNAYTFLRSRLGLEARPVEGVTAFLQVQDSRVLGEERDATGAFNTISNTKNLDLHQAYLKLDDFPFKGFSVKLGRMELVYGNERIVGAVGWNNVARAFDGGLLRWADPKRSLDLFMMNTGETTIPPAAALPGNVSFSRDEGQLLSGVVFSTIVIESHKADFYFFHRWLRKQSVPGRDDLSRFTAGLLSKGLFGDLSYEAEAAYQGGTITTSDVNAFMVTGALSYATGRALLSSVTIGADYLSGTPDGSREVKTFDPEFYTGHKFHGFMDYFVVIPLATMNRGLRDAYIRLVSNPSSSSSVSLWLHDFATAESAGGVSAIGQEIDLVWLIRYNRHVVLEAGMSGFVPGDRMRSRFGGNDVATWGYVSASVSF